MRKLLVLLALVAMPALAADSYVFAQNGRTITNGAPINVKALRAKYSGSFLWFSLNGKSYITRDPKVLARIGPIYDPLFSTDLDQLFRARRSDELAERANAIAVKANEYAAHVNELNRQIERALHDVTTQLVKQGLATKAD